MTHQITTEPGLPCRDCRGSDVAGCFTQDPCPSCEGRGRGSCLRLPHSYLATITPGPDGWSWTLLSLDAETGGSGIQATEAAAQDAARRCWAGIEADWLADRLASAVLLVAVARFGPTRAAVGAAYAAVATSAAFEREDDPGAAWSCEDCGWPGPLPGEPPAGAECDSCGGALTRTRN